MIKLPIEPQDLVKLILAVLVIVGAILIQYTDHNLPPWLLIAVSGIISYYFGLTSNTR